MRSRRGRDEEEMEEDERKTRLLQRGGGSLGPWGAASWEPEFNEPAVNNRGRGLLGNEASRHAAGGGTTSL